MRADLFLAPTDLKRAEDRFHLVLVAGLLVPACGQVVPGGALLADADGAALGVVDDVVFDDPAFAPVSPQQARLIGGGGRPRAGGLGHLEPAHGDVVLPRLERVETAHAHVDLDQFLVGVRTLKIRVNRRAFVVRFTEPAVNCLLRMQDQFIGFEPPQAIHPRADDRIFHLIHGISLVKGKAIEIHLARMAVHAGRVHEPIAF